MTNQEAIIAAIKPYLAQEDTITLEMINAGVDGGAQYSAEAKEGIYKAAYEVLKAMKVVGGITEGGFSIQYRPQELSQKMVTVAYSSGNSDLINEANKLKPTIRGVNAW